MDLWTQRGEAAARKVTNHAWLLFVAGVVVAVGAEIAARTAGPEALSGSLRIAVSSVSTALLELGFLLVIFGRMLVRAGAAGLLSDIGKTAGLQSSSSTVLIRGGLWLFAEVVGLSLAAWLVYRWGKSGIDLETWPFTPALPFLMITDMMSFVALLVAVGMIFVGVARAFSRK